MLRYIFMLGVCWVECNNLIFHFVSDSVSQKVEAGPYMQLYTREPGWGQLDIVDAIFDGLDGCDEYVIWVASMWRAYGRLSAQ